MTRKSNEPLTADVLDQMGCAEPNCKHDHSELYFAQHCHPGAYLEARYVKIDHTLVLSCAECERTVATIGVAPHDLRS